MSILRIILVKNRIFQREGASPTNHCWCQKTRVIAVSCGIKIFAVRCLVLSQYTHLTDRQTDGLTEFRQQYRALHYMQSHGKNENPLQTPAHSAFASHAERSLPMGFLCIYYCGVNSLIGNVAVVHKRTTAIYAENGRNPLFKYVSQWQK